MRRYGPPGSPGAPEQRTALETANDVHEALSKARQMYETGLVNLSIEDQAGHKIDGDELLDPRILPSRTGMPPPSSIQVEDSSISEQGPTVEATFTSCMLGER
jgi:hypothetical protein